jgi:hypothetical protein
MKRPIRYQEVLLWLMVSVSLSLMIYGTLRNEMARRRAPKLVPEIADGTNLGGLPVTDTKGRKSVVPLQGRYLVAFLDTECGPCRRQVDTLNRAARQGRFSGVLAVFSETAPKVMEFESSVSPEFNCVIDTGRGPISQHPLTTFPQTVEIDDGRVVRSWVGYQERLE